MTLDTATTLTPAEALEQARRFFTGSGATIQASIEEESDTHITFNTFRSRIVVSAFPDPRDEAPTRVRVSTLREEGAVGKFVTHLRTVTSSRLERGARGDA